MSTRCPSAPVARLAVAFEQLWRLLGGPALEKEHRFDKRRRWRFDYAYIATRIAVEINGGVWSQGRHNQGKGYLNDLDKLNAAQTPVSVCSSSAPGKSIGQFADDYRHDTGGLKTLNNRQPY